MTLHDLKNMETNKIILGDSLEILKTLPSESVNCVITSPPYWNLRDYGVAGQLGLESTFQEYINKLCGIFDEVKRVLKKDGTCWVNLGDTYSGNKEGKTDNKVSEYLKDTSVGIHKKATIQEKCLCQIPSRFAIEMTNHGWILRNRLIWWKPNCMPSSVKDRFTVDYEDVFFFVKNKRYFFEQQTEPLAKATIERAKSGTWKSKKESKLGKKVLSMDYENFNKAVLKMVERGYRNMRSVWRIPPTQFKEAHFATFPEALIEPMVKAGCPEKGTIIDPFMGAGTTAVVCKKLNRQWLGIELNPKYIEIAMRRINGTTPPML